MFMFPLSPHASYMNKPGGITMPACDGHFDQYFIFVMDIQNKSSIILPETQIAIPKCIQMDSYCAIVTMPVCSTF